MKFGLNQQQYDFINKTVVSPLVREGARVFCFGSRARGTHNPYSDLDIMVEADDKDVSGKISEIRETLIESNFPYKVDIVQWSDFAESYKPGYLADRKPFVDPTSL